MASRSAPSRCSRTHSPTWRRAHLPSIAASYLSTIFEFNAQLRFNAQLLVICYTCNA